MSNDNQLMIKYIFIGNALDLREIGEYHFQRDVNYDIGCKKIFTSYCSSDIQSNIKRRNRVKTNNFNTDYCYYISENQTFFICIVENTFHESNVYKMFEEIEKRELLYLCNADGTLNSSGTDKLKEIIDGFQNATDSTLLIENKNDVGSLELVMNKNEDEVENEEDANLLRRKIIVITVIILIIAGIIIPIIIVFAGKKNDENDIKNDFENESEIKIDEKDNTAIDSQSKFSLNDMWDLQNSIVKCSSGYGLSKFSMSGSQSNFIVSWRCKLLPGYKESTIQFTNWNEKQSNTGFHFLDRHMTYCDKGSVISEWNVEPHPTKSDQFRIRYQCSVANVKCSDYIKTPYSSFSSFSMSNLIGMIVDVSESFIGNFQIMGDWKINKKYITYTKCDPI